MKISSSSLKWWGLGGAILVAALVVSNLNFGDNLVYFYTPREAVEKAQSLSAKSVKVGGMIKPGSVVWNAQDLDLAFVLTDLKGTEIGVTHKGVKPDMFQEGQGVVVEGRIDNAGKALVARKLMVKHSEEYKATGDHSTMNKAMIEDSLFKGEEAAQ